MENLMTVKTAPAAVGAFSTASNFEDAQRMAAALVSSSMVPKHYQGRDNIGNAIIALEIAQRIDASPLLVMQNLYLVHGQPSWSAKFLIACFNSCGRFAPIRYEWRGEEGQDDYGCRAVSSANGEPIEGPWITWQLVKSEGWLGKSGSKWKTMPEKMFRYRAAAWMIDTVAPELSMGLPTAEDAGDYINVDPSTGEVVERGRENIVELETALDGQQAAASDLDAKEIASIDRCVSLDDLYMLRQVIKTPSKLVQKALADKETELKGSTNGSD